MPTKAPVEAKDKPPPSTADIKSETPEKEEGPARPRVQRATASSPDAMPPAQAAKVLSTPQPAAGAPGKARAMTTMQQAVGNTRAGQIAKAGASAPGNTPLVRRQPAEATGQSPAKAGSPQGKSATAAAGDITEDLKQKVAATILAESAPGQATDIGWIYYNRVSDAKGESGLKGSSAYRGKGVWYQIWLYMLGDTTYGKNSLPKQNEFKGFSTVKDFCEKNGYMQTTAAQRAESVKQLVDDMFAKPTDNPYQGWIGQGNLDDFNNKSAPKSLYWKQARAYYWLQQQGKVKYIYVKVLPAGKSTQFIFDADSIGKYYTAHTLPADVPLYKLSE